MLRIHSLLAAAAVLTAAPPAWSQTATCPINGVKAFTTARAQAYTFETVSSTAADCEIYRSTSSIVVSGAATTDGVCQFLIFGGKALNGNWKIANVEVSGAGVTILVPAATVGGGHGRLLRIPVDAGETKVVSVRVVKLKGGACAQVTDAFD